eukprot:11520946-Alexandrium_andersonii.AAC.1
MVEVWLFLGVPARARRQGPARVAGGPQGPRGVLCLALAGLSADCGRDPWRFGVQAAAGSTEGHRGLRRCSWTHSRPRLRSLHRKQCEQ